MKTVSCAFTGHRPQSLPFGFNETDSRLHDGVCRAVVALKAIRRGKNRMSRLHQGRFAVAALTEYVYN